MDRPDALSKSLVDAVLELHRRQLWQSNGGDALFSVRLPGEPDPEIVTISGHGGVNYGLIVARGPRAWSQMHRFVTEPDRLPEISADATLLSVTMDTLSRLPPELRQLLERARHSARRDSLVPVALVLTGRDSVVPPSRAQMRVLLAVIRTILRADDAGEFRPTPMRRGAQQLLELTPTGEGRDMTVECRLVPWPDTVAGSGAGGSSFRDAAQGFIRLDERWSVGFVLQSGPHQTTDGVSLMAVLLRPDADVLAVNAIATGDVDEAREWLAKVISGEARRDGVRGIPMKVVFGDAALAKACGAELERLDVAVTVDERDLVLAQFDREMNAQGDDPGSGTSPEDYEEPRPRTREEWKAVDRLVTESLAGETWRDDARAKKALVKYFGSNEVVGRVLTEFKHFEPMASFVEWFVADYRVTRRSKTVIESLLAKKSLSPWQRELLEARRQARLSIYRVQYCEPGSHLVVEDVTDGSLHTVHDQLLSEALSRGLVLPMRLSTVAEWVFPALGGPPIPSFGAQRALFHLERLGVDLTPQGLRAAGPRLGSLWRFLLGEKDRPLRVANTDSELLEFQTATFKVSNVKELERALREQPGVEFDESEGQWVWSRTNSSGPDAGRDTLLGRLNLIDDTLVVEVNSAERLRRIRLWVDKLPGVRFVSARSEAWDRTDRPLDDRLESKPAAPPSPELRKALEDAIHENALRWLDTPIPILDGLTPRQACKTEAGRRRVAIIIRTMPDSMTPTGPIAPPRALLLKELGLPSQEA